jgi:Mitochondrial import 2
MSTASESFVLPSNPSPSGTHDDDVDSLPSTSTGSSTDEHEVDSDAEREWRESLQQLELLLTIFVIPYVGKYFGRKAAYWGELGAIGREES